MSSRSSGGTRKYRVNTRKMVVSVCVCVLIIAAIAAALLLLNADPALDQPTVGTSASVTADGVATKIYTEKHPYYSVSITLPDEETSPYPQEMKAFSDEMLAEFHTKLEALEGSEILSKDDPCVLIVDFTRSAFGGYYNYTVTADPFIPGSVSKTSTVRKVFLTDAQTGEWLEAAELFAESYDYKKAFAQLLVGTLKTDGSAEDAFADILERYSTDDTLYDARLELTENGVNLMTGEDVYEQTPFVTLPYRACYRSLNAEIPEDYLPKEPTPIDPEVEKVVALTFDDGPNPKVTPKLLDLLDRYNAKATFFMIGYNISWQNDLVKEVLARGHCVGNHSTEHDSYSKMSVSGVVADATEIFDKLESILGRRPHLLRPPGGAIDQERADALGVPIILWDVDPLDWKYRNAETVSQNILKSVKSGDIVLSHDLYESTYEAMEIVIPELARQGYRFVTVDELLGISDDNYDYYAGKIITYRSTVKKLRADGLL